MTDKLMDRQTDKVKTSSPLRVSCGGLKQHLALLKKNGITFASLMVSQNNRHLYFFLFTEDDLRIKFTNFYRDLHRALSVITFDIYLNYQLSKIITCILS